MDNILLMAKSENEGVAMSKALCGALKSNPAGPLRPKVRNFFGRPIDFLGHRLTVMGEQVKIGPTPHNEMEFQQEIASAFSFLKHEADTSASNEKYSPGGVILGE